MIISHPKKNFKQQSEEYIKTYPELSLAAIRRKKDKLIRVWYLMRHIDKEGSARVLKNDLRAFVKEQEIISQETLRKTLLNGDNQLWNIKRTKKGITYRYRSLEKAAIFLNAVPTRAVMIPLSAFSKLGRMRAQFYSSLFITITNPIARATICRVWGIKKTTQRRYQKVAGVKVIRNIAKEEIDPEEGWGETKEGSFVYYENGKWLLIQDLPNSYRSNLKRAPRGMVTRVRKWLWSLRDQGRESNHRRYFDRAKDALRSKRPANPAFFRDKRFNVKSNGWDQKRFHGRLVWGVYNQVYA